MVDSFGPGASNSTPDVSLLNVKVKESTAKHRDKLSKIACQIWLLMFPEFFVPAFLTDDCDLRSDRDLMSSVWNSSTKRGAMDFTMTQSPLRQQELGNVC